MNQADVVFELGKFKKDIDECTNGANLDWLAFKVLGCLKELQYYNTSPELQTDLTELINSLETGAIHEAKMFTINKPLTVPRLIPEDNRNFIQARARVAEIITQYI